ncbi:hypothetical protein [Streptomyces sp. NPDC008317]|uniref:hypothetical protein n=1 Tax=Streptomyces sp. NPDC008317 TaxID=3364827 RepID=UPI0036EBB415
MLSGGDQQRQRPLALLARQMILGGEAALEPAQTVVVGLRAGSAGRFLLSMSVPAGACGVVMGPADRGVDVDLPRDQTCRIRPSLQYNGFSTAH